MGDRPDQLCDRVLAEQAGEVALAFRSEQLPTSIRSYRYLPRVKSEYRLLHVFIALYSSYSY